MSNNRGSSQEPACVRECLDALEQAERTIEHAARSLCQVAGLGTEWSDLCVLCFQVRKHQQAIHTKWIEVTAAVKQPNPYATGGAGKAHESRKGRGTGPIPPIAGPPVDTELGDVD
jgi:hypothetical protein